jgi:ketosteroid isomerase-like protein
MRRIAHTLLFLAALAMSPLGLMAQNGEQMKVLPQGELDVVKVLLAQERAWNAGNLRGFLETYKSSPDIVIISNGIARGFETLYATYLKNYPDRASMGTLSFEDLEPHLLDDHFATATGKFRLERAKNKGGNVTGIFSLVLEKTADGWKVILDHTT